MDTATVHDAISDAREWLGHRDAHKNHLVKELEIARARVAEIEGLLAELGATPTTAQPQATAQSEQRPVAKAPRLTAGSDPKKASIPEIITKVVAESRGMTSGDIVRAVLAIKPTGRQVVYPAVYRMARDGRLRQEREKYFIGGSDKAAQ